MTRNLIRKVVIVNKKLFKLMTEFVSKVTDLFNVGPAVILLLNGDEPIVTFLFFLITLLSLNNADHATLQYAPGKGRFIHQN